MHCIDLHTHTTFSDGTFSPKDLMEYAKNKDLKAISVTDHDTVEGLYEAESHAKHLNLEFVPGLEISALYNSNLEIHILGYFIDSKNKELLETLKNYRLIREKRNRKIIAIFNEDGINVSLDDIKAISGGDVISRGHFAKFLVEGGYYETVKDAFRHYLARGKRAYVKRDLPDCKQAIAAINRASGIAVLAHPVQYGLDYYSVDNIARELRLVGLKGIEAIYSTNNEEDEKKYCKIAAKHSLVITGGSDFHGKNKPGLDLGTGYGNLCIDYNFLANLKRLLG